MRSMVSAISARGTVTTASWMSCSRRRSAPIAEPAWSVPTPPGWPVPQAFRRSSASAPRTSPIGMRSGRSRSEERTRSDSEAAPSLVRSATRFGAAHCSSRVSSISTTRSPVLATSASSALTSVVLPVEVPPATRMFLRVAHGRAQQLGLRAGHDAGVDIVAEREDGDGGPADGEARRRHHRRHQALEPLPAFRQLGRDARAAGMDLDADMVRDEAHDALGVGRRDAAAGILEAARQPVDPQPAVGIEHHLDDAGIFEIGRRSPARARCAACARRGRRLRTGRRSSSRRTPRARLTRGGLISGVD